MKAFTALYLIESGQALELVRQHIQCKREVNASNAQIAAELGVDKASTDFRGGQITAVVFPKGVPEGWTARSRKNGTSRPKKGTVWAARFAAQKRCADQSQLIADAFNVPLTIHYDKVGDWSGCGLLGMPFSECGFLYMSPDGPYGLWTPDVAAYVVAREAEGFHVEEPAKSYSMELPGCRRMLKEEWELMVAEKRLQEARASSSATEA